MRRFVLTAFFVFALQATVLGHVDAVVAQVGRRPRRAPVKREGGGVEGRGKRGHLALGRRRVDPVRPQRGLELLASYNFV